MNKYHVYISIITKLCCTSITSCWFAIWKLNKLCSKKKNSILHLPKGAIRVSIYSGGVPTFAGRNLPAERQSRALRRAAHTATRGSAAPNSPSENRCHTVAPVQRAAGNRARGKLFPPAPRAARGGQHRSEQRCAAFTVCQPLCHVFRNTPRKWRALALGLPPRKTPV